MGPVRLALLLLLAAAGVGVGEAVYIPYNTSAGVVPGKLNVHVVPHTHDDVGWLKTVDQYYVGSNNSIQGACVQNVLDSLIPALLKDENRKFIYVEQAFFQRWWRNQNDIIKDTVKGLLNSGRLELINGGMCMHDEAAVHYIDMIDQTTLGHRYIKEEFGQIPRIGWQIDPFGHSAVQAYLLGAEVGFDAFYFFRIDYQDRDTRKGTKELEVVWRGSKTLGSSADIFAGIFPKNYEPPPGEFYFEVDDSSPVVQDDPLLFDYNVEERVNDFVAAAVAQANITRTNHIMFTMGTDFKYQYAESWFRNMDKLIHYVNKDGRVNALYSTPSIYTDAKYAANEQWPLKTNDFFPYADNPNAYWTGYFTSRPAFKRYVRMMSGYYLAARQLEFFKGRHSSGLTTDSLGDALALAQHHDAVTGTEKQHVADDYAKRLSIGYTQAQELVSTSLACLTESGSKSRCSSPVTKFSQCLLLNVTYCPPSEMDFSKGKSLVVLVYNSLGWKREDVLRIPVFSDSIVVHDSEGREIESQLLPIATALLNIRDKHVKAYLGTTPGAKPMFWLVFPVSIPPLGFNTYFVSNSKKSAHISSKSTQYSPQGSESSNIQVGQGNLKLKYNAAGTLSMYSDSKTQVQANFEQKYKYYIGQDGNGSDPQASGAYIFRPNGTVPINTDGQVPLTVLRGPILDEVHQQINSWIYQITRVYKGKDYVETEFIVGPIPVDDGNGKEVASEIVTNMVTNKTFYTDSSGRDFIKRIRDYRSEWKIEVHQPIAGNYYPVNLGIYVEDGSKELSVLVDRSIGGSSIKDGQIELMLHRRLLHDDGRGVAEALNETVCLDKQCEGLIIEGKYYVKIDPQGEGARWRRTFGQEIYSPLLLAFTEQDGGNWVNSHVAKFSAMDSTYSLPDNVALLTLQELEDGSVLLRFAHLFEVLHGHPSFRLFQGLAKGNTDIILYCMVSERPPEATEAPGTPAAATLGFVEAKSDTSLFVYHHGAETAYLLLYVDDIVLTASSESLLRRLITSLQAEFPVKDLGVLHHFLGVTVEPRPTGLFLHQRQYTLDILDRAGMTDCKPCSTPVDTQGKQSEAEGPSVSDPSAYRSLAGALQYLTFTRPDITYAVQQVCLHMHDPREPHLTALKRLLRYLRGTVDYGLLLHRSASSELVVYTDADWAGCPDTRRSTSGYAVFLGGNLVSWSSKRQPVVSRSSAEAEYRAVANGVAEASWLRQLLAELRSPLSRSTLVYCDNVSAVYLSTNPVQHQRTKHVEIDLHFVRDRVAIGDVRVLHVPTTSQFADIFTKGLPSSTFTEFRSSLNITSG